MRVFCTGFNLYGQFINCHRSVVENFIDCNYDEIVKFIPSHTFSLAFKGKEIVLHGTKDGQTHQIQKIQIPQTLEIQETACTDRRIVFLGKNGTLFKLELDQVSEPPTALPAICAWDEGKEDQIVKIACGSKINVAVSRLGKVFNLPNKLKYENKNIVDLSAGYEHCVILDKEGCVYTFGRGSRGQLGHGSLEDESEPKLIEALAGIRISKIAAGGWHSCAVSEEGDLYTWGWNGNGQLGLSKSEQKGISVMALPRVVDCENSQSDEPSNLNVINVGCGSRHTVALLDNGKLYGAGWNKYHQLGSVQSSTEDLYSMTFLYDFSETTVTNLKCGPWSTAIVVD